MGSGDLEGFRASGLGAPSPKLLRVEGLGFGGI